MPAARLQAGDLVLPARLVTDTGLIAQKLDRRLRTILGTWTEDDSVGLPWDRWAADPKRLTPAILSAAVRAQIAASNAAGSLASNQRVSTPKSLSSPRPIARLGS